MADSALEAQGPAQGYLFSGAAAAAAAAAAGHGGGAGRGSSERGGARRGERATGSTRAAELTGSGLGSVGVSSAVPQNASAPAGADARAQSAEKAPGFELAQTDAVSWLRGLPNDSVDLFITDPPYESLEKHRAVGTTTRLKHSKASSNDWFPIFPNDRFLELFKEVHRVLKRDRHFYLFCDAETMFVAKPIAESVGFKFWKPLVWDKRKIGMGYHYRARCEFILFFEKGKRRLNDLGQADVIEYPSIRGGYPTEKPVGVSQVLVRQSTQAGELVVDPFMGSGSVGAAALAEGRDFLGNDLCAHALQWSQARLLEHGVERRVCPLSQARQGALL